MPRIYMTDGCREWMGAKSAAGYGQVSFNGKRTYVHRVMYEVFYGPIPDGLTIDHLCRNRGCCRPEHLEAVTHRVNMSRGSWAIKTHCPQGHPYDEANTMYRKTKYGRGRVCRTCKKEQRRPC